MKKLFRLNKNVKIILWKTLIILETHPQLIDILIQFIIYVVQSSLQN